MLKSSSNYIINRNLDNHFRDNRYLRRADAQNDDNDVDRENNKS